MAADLLCTPLRRLHNDLVSIRPIDIAVFSAGALCIVAMPVCGIFAGRLGASFLPVSNTLSYLLIGGYATLRRPGHRAARRMLLWGALLCIAFGWGTVYSAVVAQGAAPAWGWLGVLAIDALSWASASAALAFIVVFPDGHYRAPLDRWIVRCVAVLLPFVLLGILYGTPVIATTDFVWGDGVTAPNPSYVPALSGLGTVSAWAVRVVTPAVILCGAVLLLVRWRASGPADRRRIQWPLAAAATMAVLDIGLGGLTSFGPPLPLWLQTLLYLPVAFVLPGGILIGMLWYDLLDVGVVLRRSLLYAGLWVVIALGYVALSGVAGVLAAERMPLAVAVATTVVVVAGAATGQRRLVALLDRAVFGRRLDGPALMVDVGRRLTDGSSPEEIAATVADAVRQGARAEWVQVRIGDATAFTGRPGAAPAVTVPLVSGSVGIGEIACGPREIGRYGDRDRALLESLARQAALTAANAALSADLAAKVDDLAASRVRILRAEESGRRRLERDLHDGVQQDLVVLLTRLGLAANQLRRDPVLARTTLDEARTDARGALEDLQELVRGIHPTLLTDRGLVAAVEERATRVPIPVRVVGDDGARGGRAPAEVEGAAYFAISECLTNAVKHAHARSATVHIAQDMHELRIEVADDGDGFDPAVAESRGTGLAGLRDRVETLGGTVEVSGLDGARIRMSLPTGGAGATDG